MTIVRLIGSLTVFGTPPYLTWILLIKFCILLFIQNSRVEDKKIFSKNLIDSAAKKNDI
jgi:hypothetical protein